MILTTQKKRDVFGLPFTVSGWLALKWKWPAGRVWWRKVLTSWQPRTEREGRTRDRREDLSRSHLPGPVSSDKPHLLRVG